MLVTPSFAVEFANIIVAVLNCNNLQLAIIQRNVAQVENIIRSSPSTAHFQNAIGQSPLHVAADWPWATVLLLMNGADPYQVDSTRCTAIDYACGLENYEVVKILLDAGSPLPVHDPLARLLRGDGWYSCDQIFQLIISHLALRRRELLQIARTLLPEATLSNIVPPNEAVPDSSAYPLIAAVCAAGHTTKPEYWYYHPRGLYQSYHMFPAAADILYEAGFTDLDGQDMLDRTPLTSPNESDMIVWLYRRGASFAEWTPHESKKLSAPSMPSIYLAINGVVRSIYRTIDWRVHDKSLLRWLSEDDFKALNIFLQDDFSDHRDLCRCPCSSGGCSPESIFLKTLLGQVGYTSKEGYSSTPVHPLPMFIELVDKFMIRLHGKLAPSAFTRMNQAAIRVVLVSDLGIRHLCCKTLIYTGFGPPPCQEEADEMREEDRLLTERFEALLPKAQSAWEKSSKGFTEFWRDFHKANICKRRNGPVDETEFERLRELGVTVHRRGDEEEYCDSLYGDEEGYCESLSDDEDEHCASSSPNGTQPPESFNADEDEAGVDDTE